MPKRKKQHLAQLLGFASLMLCFVVSASAQDVATSVPVIYQHHPMTLSFNGPETSEGATPNPFTDYRLLVEFSRIEDGKAAETKIIRGFYAADGNAAQTGAESGNIWKARFAPPTTGQWKYKAALRRGDQIAINDDPDFGEAIELTHQSGTFSVVHFSEVDGTDQSSRDFRKRGRIIVDGTYFRFGEKGDYWLKAGADSPENLLAYFEFDGTYRTSDKARDGENKPTEELHRFPTHAQDWNEGDPTWRQGKGKSLIGAINYLSSTGMNVSYFLTNNIKGDGHDVWPYISHDGFSRFDCSKLAQWEIVFDHMQRKGIMLHVVTQETENEKLLDDGDTGPLRKLYYRELISRFAHHPALVWNLGEENGPAEFSPNGQNAIQQKAMSDYLKQNDPYGHPVVIHTHSTAKDKDHILEPLVGHGTLDGLSFQVDQPKRAHKELVTWKQKARKSGKPWLITMDEIGMWHTGVLPDSVDPDHDGLRHQVLWGSLMAGGAGVEWYFGAKQQHNDLNCEDWRQHENIWLQSKIAIDFFQQHLPFWEMEPADNLLVGDGYCFAKPNHTYAIYLPSNADQPDQSKEAVERKISLPAKHGKFTVHWFNPKQGGELQIGSVAEILSGDSTAGDTPKVKIGTPPKSSDGKMTSKDWVVLLRLSDK